MQQRQLRLGDILDDYCPRERRVTNHAVVAMVGEDVKQTRCTTCDTEHVYKQAKVPRQRRKNEAPARPMPRSHAGAPKRVSTPGNSNNNHEDAGPADDTVAAIIDESATEDSERRRRDAGSASGSLHEQRRRW